MIALPALSAVPWRLIGAVVVAAGLVAAGWTLGGKAVQARWDAHEVEIAKDRALHDEARRADEARRQAASDEVENELESELAKLRAARRGPARVVRLCRPADPDHVRDAPASGSPDGPASGGDVQIAAGPDIGRELYQLADDADDDAARLRAAQAWMRAVTASDTTEADRDLRP